MIDYLDTSVLVAALTHEIRTEEIQTWLTDQPVDRLVISDWVTTEFSGALSIKVRTGQLTVTFRADALATFTTLVEDSLSVLPVTHADFQLAARYADQHSSGLRSGDALHLAIAANNGVRIQSLDQRLVEAAQAVGVSATLR